MVTFDGVRRTTRLPAAAGRPQWGCAAEFAEQALGFELYARQKEVLAERRPMLLLNCSRQWGKSTVTAIRAVWEAVSRPGSLTVVAAPTLRQSGELVEKARGMARELGERGAGDGLNAVSVKFGNGSRIVGLPGREGTIRGFSAPSLVVVDEAARVPDEVYRALRPMLATVDGDLWAMSTPWGKRGFFYEAWACPPTRSHGDWERVAVPAWECPRIRPEQVEADRLEMGDEWVRQEYGCEFVDTTEQLFSYDVVMAAITDEIKPLFATGSEDE